MLKNRLFWFSVTVLAAYLLAGYLAGPLVVQPRLEQYLSGHLGRDLRVARVRVDPLTWTVRLEAAQLLATGPQSLWPGVALSAAVVDLRFSFWRLSPALAALRLQAPVLVLDSESAPVPAARHALVGLWQQWQEHAKIDAGLDPVPIKRWTVEAGRLLQRSAAAPTEAVLMDDISLQTGPHDTAGLREYTVTFSVAGNVDISSQGLFRPQDLSASGQYQLKSAVATHASLAELLLAGAFSSHLSAEGIQIELSASQLYSEQASGCLLDGLLCAAMAPLQADFDARLVAAREGIRVLQGKARMNAFQLSASLGQGRVTLADQRHFTSAQFELSLPQANAPGAPDRGTSRNFVVRLNAADSHQYQMAGQLDMQSQATDAQFHVDGGQISGALQGQRMADQQANTAYSRLDLQLENPAASLARSFMDDYFSDDWEARTLQLQLAASLDSEGLRLQENIRLPNLRLLPDPESEAQATSGTEADTTLDSQWLIALLRDPNDLIELTIPELVVGSAVPIGLDQLIQRQTLRLLTELSEQPFTGLAKAMHVGSQDLHEIRFAPGSAALDAASNTALASLAAILSQRPGLGITLAGVYDPLLDKQALQTEQVRTHIALAMAAGLDFRTGARPPELSDPLAQSVIDEFARRQIPAVVMQSVAARFGLAAADPAALPEDEILAYYATLFELLVNNADISQSAMTSLARYRAQAVIETLENAGVAPARLETRGQASSNDAPGDGIALPVQLQIWPGSRTAPAP